MLIYVSVNGVKDFCICNLSKNKVRFRYNLVYFTACEVDQQEHLLEWSVD